MATVYYRSSITLNNAADWLEFILDTPFNCMARVVINQMFDQWEPDPNDQAGFQRKQFI
jgi:phage terminase large subunit-like protein